MKGFLIGIGAFLGITLWTGLVVKVTEDVIYGEIASKLELIDKIRKEKKSK